MQLPRPKTLLWMSTAAALITIVLKTLAWYVTGSVALLSDAMESFVNLAGAVFALTMITIAQRPADDDHPLGHHKAEYFSSGFEGFLILGAALGIIWTSVDRLFHPQPLEQLGWGLAFSMVSTLLNGAGAWVLLKAAKLHNSIALEGDGRHLLTDVYTSVGVVAGVLLVGATQWLWVDAVVGILVALNIVREGWHLIWQSSQGLMDRALPPEQRERIEHTLAAFAQHEHVRFDHLTTRAAGQRSYLSLHMHMPANWPLARAAALRAQVEQALHGCNAQLHLTIEMLPADVEPSTTG